MTPDDRPVTKADLSEAIASIGQLIEIEMKHQSTDILELRTWRDQFIAEGGPWRLLHMRVNALEYLARSVKWVIAALTPIALWATIEMIKAAVAWMQSGP